jgi:hypothetical protein
VNDTHEMQTMQLYVPPFDSLLRRLGVTRSELGSGVVSVPVNLLKLLLQVSLAHSDFNEAGYLRSNPDVAEAVRNGSVESALLHYVGFGYFEGRLGATPDVDEAWYLHAYADVADAAKAQQVASATEHFESVGAGEGRSPNADCAPVAEQWRKAMESV